MGLDLGQLKELVILPALNILGPNIASPQAVSLTAGTFLKESGLTYITQLNNGPARGLGQMEKVTHDDMWTTYLDLAPNKALAAAVTETLVPLVQEWDQLLFNMRYMAVMTRLKYRRSPLALPGPNDAAGMAAMWKVVYNSSLGAGVVDAATVACFTAAIAA